MSFEFKLPDIGEGVVEGEIVEWLIAEGDAVAEDQPIVAVMTDKATVEIPSPKAGTITKLGAAAGETVPVGSVLVTIEPSDGSASAPAATPAAEAPKPAAAAPAPKAVPAPKAAPAPAPKAAPAPVAVAPSTAAAPGEVLASPATRKRARELGVDLASVRGTGQRGRITVDDVDQAAARPAAAPVAAAAGGALAPAPAAAQAPLLALPRRDFGPGEMLEERVPLKGLRKRIADAMINSKHTAAHFAYVDECDMTELVALRKRLKPEAEKYGVKLTFLPFIVKALVPCLKEHPLLNASLDDATGELVLKKYYNIGIATDTPQGLTVPVIKDVERKSILEIAAEMTELTNRARAQRTKMEDITDGTFTVTSTGNIGGLFATPIINHPEVGILGVPKIQQRPVVRDGEIVIRDMIHLAISLDHRVVDGAVGARFMNTLISYLSEPSRIFLELA